MYAFDYRRPKTLDEAELALKVLPGAKLLAGGQTLIPTMKLRLNRPGGIVDLGSVSGLNGIERQDGMLMIGATATHADVATSPIVAAAIKGLAHVAGEIGDPQVRNRGTIGGSLANNDPAADYPAAVLSLRASLHTTQRVIAADDFFRGLYETALRPNEIITAVHFPVPERAAYEKFRQPASRFSIVGVMVAKTGAGARVAVTGAGSCVFRCKPLEAALTRKFAPESCDGILIEATGLNEDLHGSAEYRAHLIPILAKRAVARALG